MGFVHVSPSGARGKFTWCPRSGSTHSSQSLAWRLFKIMSLVHESKRPQNGTHCDSACLHVRFLWRYTWFSSLSLKLARSLQVSPVAGSMQTADAQTLSVATLLECTLKHAPTEGAPIMYTVVVVRALRAIRLLRVLRFCRGLRMFLSACSFTITGMSSIITESGRKAQLDNLLKKETLHVLDKSTVQIFAGACARQIVR